VFLTNWRPIESPKLFIIDICLKYMPPEAHNGPSESTSTTQPEQHQTYSQRPTNNLRSLRHISANPVHLLGQHIIIPVLSSPSSSPTLKQPKTEVRCEQFAVPGGPERLSRLRQLTSVSPNDAPSIQLRRDRSPTAPSVNPDLPRSLTGPMGRQTHACEPWEGHRPTQARP
jgi:hypothetical protein